MLKPYLVVLLSLFALKIGAQVEDLPTDFRQHNLSQLNSSLFHPTFSLDRNEPRSISLWSRWQWQSIDSDPSTLFINYTQKISNTLAGGIGYLQHNTGIYLQSGVLTNFAWREAINDKTAISVGTNVFFFGQELANEQLVLLPEENTTEIFADNSFSIQFSPGVRLESGDFAIGFTYQNALNITVSGEDNASDYSSFLGFISNDFQVNLFGASSYIRPQAYVNAVSGSDSQVGALAVLSHPNFWIQGGYNSYYGPSLGLGATLAKSLAIGALLEFPTGEALSNEDTTIELVVSYKLGKQLFEKEESVEDNEESLVPEPNEAFQPEKEMPKQKETVETQKIEAEKIETEVIPKTKPISKRKQRQQERARRDSIAKAEEAVLRLKMEKIRKDSIQNLRAKELRQKKINDSIAQEQRKAMQLAKEQARLDSLAAIELKKDVVLLPNEKYQEVTNEEGLQPGFYLIANVFGTKRYYENFMITLKRKGLNPGSFYRETNGYNYVYLKRYNSIQEARKDRDSKFNGQYEEKLWIFRVR